MEPTIAESGWGGPSRYHIFQSLLNFRDGVRPGQNLGPPVPQLLTKKLWFSRDLRLPYLICMCRYSI